MVAPAKGGDRGAFCMLSSGQQEFLKDIRRIGCTSGCGHESIEECQLQLKNMYMLVKSLLCTMRVSP